MVFYLKVNRDIEYTFRNFQHWINILSCGGNNRCIVICDNILLEEKLKEKINFHGVKCDFIQSYMGDGEQELISYMTNERWRNAGFAHLTSFLHARDNAIDKYWNIDADDTVFCLDYPRSMQLLNTVEQYANENKIDLFSLDMWRSKSYGAHWSFGVTYTNGRVDWKNIITRNFDYIGKKTSCFGNGIHPKNIDEFFTYIRENDSTVNVQTFYVENLLFIHYSDDFINNPVQSGVFLWKKELLHSPILEAIFGAHSMGSIPIAKDVKKIDIGINDREGQFFLAKAAQYTMECGNVIESKDYNDEIKRVICWQADPIIDSIVASKTEEDIYLFGCDPVLISRIKTKFDKSGIVVKGIFDNNPRKQGSVCCGIPVVSPEIITDLKKGNIRILIVVRHYRQISRQLKALGYTKEPTLLVNYSNLLDYDCEKSIETYFEEKKRDV